MSAAVRGTLIVIAGRWVERILGFASTLVLARLLAPADFGIVAMAWLVTMFLETFLDIGIGVQLVQKPNPQASHYHTGFTLRLIQAVVLAVLLVAAAPLAARYFNEPRIATILTVMAPAPILSSLSSVGLLILQRELRFGPEFRVQVAKKVVSVVVTVAAAYWLRNFWALIIGTYAGIVVTVIGGYLVHPWRPRLTLSRAHEMWRQSGALFLRGVAGYFNGQADKLLLGRLHAPAALGAYQLAQEVAQIPSTELLSPINRILFPALSAAASDPPRLAHMFVRALSVSACVGLPAGMGLTVLASNAIDVLLGAKWHESATLMQALAWSGVVGAFHSTVITVALATGRFFAAAGASVLQLASFGAAFLVLWGATGWYSPLVIAMARIGGLVACLVLVYAYVVQVLPRGVTARLASATWRCALASAVMGVALWSMLVPASDATVPLLVTQVVSGATIYAGTLLALWVASGRPDGPETFLLDNLVLPALRRADGAIRGLDFTLRRGKR